MPESSPSLPELSKDIRDLIQYSILDELRKKMWTTLGVFLTLVTIAGLLGIPALIGNKIDTKIKNEQNIFEKLKVDLQMAKREIVVRSSVVSHLSFLWAQDLARFQMLLIRAAEEFDKPSFSINNDIKSVRQVLRLTLNKLERFDVKGDGFCYEVRMITDILNRGRLPEGANSDYSSKPLANSDWESFRRAANIHNLGKVLPELYQLYSHMYALKSSLQKGYELSMDQVLHEPLHKAELYNQYGSWVYPDYTTTLSGFYDGARPTWNRKDLEWLPETAIAAFLEQENRIAQQGAPADARTSRR